MLPLWEMVRNNPPGRGFKKPELPGVPPKDTSSPRERQLRHNDYCRAHGLPNFLSGGATCFRCGFDVFTVETGHTLVTGCPSCKRSFCS